MKLDWDGNLEYFPRIPRVLYLGFVFIGALIFNKLSIETECGYKRLANYPLIRQKLEFIPNTISEEYLPIEKYDNGKREPIVVTTSVIERYKGIDLLISAFHEASKKIKGWRLVVIGHVSNEEYYSQLQQMISHLSLANYVEFVGQKSPEAIKELYQKCSLYCSFSLRESFGIARTEAIARGLPVLTSYAGCGESLPGAILTDISDNETTVQKLELLMSDDNLRRNLSEEGQQHILGWDEITKKFLVP